MTQPWWIGLPRAFVGATHFGGPDAGDTRDHMAVSALIDQGPPVTYRTLHGKTDYFLDTAIAKLEEFGGWPVRVEPVDDDGKFGEAHVAWSDTYVTISIKRSRTANFHFVTRNHGERLVVFKHFRQAITRAPPRDTVWAITSTNSGTRLREVGVAGTPFVPDNYTADVVKAYHNLVQDLRSPDPAGRLAILDGPPGTGKTYLIRSLLHDVEDTIFLLMPPNMAESLSGPNMLPVLTDAHEEYKYSDDDRPQSKRIVLILEDADEALVPREQDNTGLISSLLNLSDGIIGHTLDLRIIATTNAKSTNIDPAILRPGRLSSCVHVGYLDHDHAQRVIERLLPDPDDQQHAWVKVTPAPNNSVSGMGFGASSTLTNAYSLAALYAAAAEVRRDRA